MANKSFFQSIKDRFSSESSEIKQLKDQLNTLVDERLDSSNYDVKFIDSEINSTGNDFSGQFSNIDQQIDVAALQRLYVTEPWVFIPIRAIARTIAGLPIQTEKKQIHKKEVTNEVTGQKEVVDKETWLPSDNTDLSKLFKSPNEYCSEAEFIELICIDLLSAGDFYIYLDSDKDLEAIAETTWDDDPETPFGRLRTLLAADTPVKGFYRIPPPLIKPVVSKDQLRIEGYMLNTSGGTFAFSPAEIIHVKLPNPTDNFKGLSPLIPAMKEILVERFGTENIIRYYKSGARLGGVINSEKSLNKEQLARFQRSFEATYTGRHNHHRTLILPPGMDYKIIQSSPISGDILQLFKESRQTLLSAFNVPPVKVGILEHANYANARAQLKVFFNDTIKPLLKFLEDGFNRSKALMPDANGNRVKFDLKNVEELQENFEEKAAAGQKCLQAAMSINEVRTKVWGLEPVEGGEVVPSLEAAKPKQQAPAPQNPIETLSHMIGAYKVLSTKDAISPVNNDMANISNDVKPTAISFEERVAQIAAQLMAQGIPLREALAKAIQQAKIEGFEPPTDPDDGSKAPKPTEEAQVANSVQSMGPLAAPPQAPAATVIVVSPEPVKDMSTEGQSALIETQMGTSEPKKPCDCGKEPCECEKQLIQDPMTKVFANGITKSMLVSKWKSLMQKTDPLIEARHKEVTKFFDKYKRIVVNGYGGNVKAFGIHKSRNSEDVDAILNQKALDELIADYTKQVDEALLDAMKEGFVDLDLKVAFDKFPKEAAIEALKKYAAQSVKYIDETTKSQLRDLLVEKFEAGADLGSIGKAINEKFAEIESGRAMTIARTEVLSAVSLGQQTKMDEFVKEYPEQKFKNMWVTSQDERVRDSHAEIEGEVVEYGQKFSNGLEYPREEGAPPEEVINCRCTLISFVEGDEKLITE